jgi:hypothetical protein
VGTPAIKLQRFSLLYKKGLFMQSRISSAILFVVATIAINYANDTTNILPENPKG